MSNDPTPDRILQLGMGFWGAKTLLSAVELGLFTELAGHPLDAQAVQEGLGLHSRSAGISLMPLVALGMLVRHWGLYANTPETDLFLDRGKSSYLGGWFEMGNSRLYHFWGSLTEGLRTGLPQNEVKEGGATSSPIRSRQPTCLPWCISCMIGIWRKRNCCWPRRMRHCPPVGP